MQKGEKAKTPLLKKQPNFSSKDPHKQYFFNYSFLLWLANDFPLSRQGH